MMLSNRLRSAKRTDFSGGFGVRSGLVAYRGALTNLGMTSRANRRRVGSPPGVLSSTYSTPASRSPWSLTLISSGDP